MEECNAERQMDLQSMDDIEKRTTDKTSNKNSTKFEGKTNVMSPSKRIIQSILSQAGIQLNGPHPWDLQVHDDRFYNKVLLNTELALGETYMDGWWDCERMDEFFYRVLKANLDTKITHSGSFWINNVLMACHKIMGYLINLQTKIRSFEVGKKHYDTGNDLFEVMLDKRMIYTCAFWDNATTLDEAQERKLAVTCKKLHLRPGMQVLDIGCGWGGMAEYLARNYDVSVVGVTISKQQFEIAKKKCEGLPVQLFLQDYRDLLKTPVQFDRIVSLGMFEHVGHKNYSTFMQVAKHSLKEDGLFLLHTIGSNKTTTITNQWIEKYIFPNSHLSSIAQIGTATENLFVMEDWQNYSANYDKTLMAWHHNFNQAYEHNENIRKKYDARFRRMWNFYLLSCAGSFRARRSQLWQMVFSHQGCLGGYQAIRD